MMVFEDDKMIVGTKLIGIKKVYSQSKATHSYNRVKYGKANITIIILNQTALIMMK